MGKKHKHEIANGNGASPAHRLQEAGAEHVRIADELAEVDAGLLECERRDRQIGPFVAQPAERAAIRAERMRLAVRRAELVPVEDAARSAVREAKRALVVAEYGAEVAELAEAFRADFKELWAWALEGEKLWARFNEHCSERTGLADRLRRAKAAAGMRPVDSPNLPAPAPLLGVAGGFFAIGPMLQRGLKDERHRRYREKNPPRYGRTPPERTATEFRQSGTITLPNDIRR